MGFYKLTTEDGQGYNIRRMHESEYCPGGGGGTSIMHIRYVPRERPPFSALNFCSRAYHFHKMTTYIVHVFRSGAFTLLYFQAILRRPRSAYCSQPERKFEDKGTIELK